MIAQWVLLTEAPWLWIFPAACLLLFVFCALAEFRKRKSTHAWLRISLLFLAHAALLLAALQPARVEKRAAEVAVLLQGGASESRLDSLLRQYPQAAVFTLANEAFSGYTRLGHVSYLQQHLPAGSTVFMLGAGFNRAELQYLEPYRLCFLPVELPGGLVELNYRRRLQWSDTLKISGTGKAEGDSLWLRLSLAGKGIDSLVLGKEDWQHFQMQALPPVSGLLHYRLDLLSHRFDTLEHYPILVNIAENKKLHLALLSGYPSFEFRHLKNWLAQEGHSIYYQTEMAPGRFSREWLNMADLKPTGLNQALLNGVDMLVIDQQYWNKLNSSALEQIEAAVKKQGLGCLILAESGSWRQPSEQWASLPALQIQKRLQEAAAWSGPGASGPTIAYYQANAAGWLPLLPNAVKEPLVLFSQQGLGRVGVSVVESTYPLLFQDHQPAYSRLWTEILNNLIKAGSSSPLIEGGSPAFVANKHELRFWQQAAKMPPVIVVEPDGTEHLLPLVQDMLVKGLWRAYFWPALQGEHVIKMQGMDSLSIMVYPSDLLPALRQFQDTKETYTFVNGMERITPSGNKVDTGLYTQKKIPTLWFYALFLVSMAGLWIEHKLSGL